MNQNILDPTEFIDRATTLMKSSYVFTRRIISALYFSLFNYWAYKTFHDQGIKGKGPNHDKFDHKDFSRTLIENNLGPQIVLLYKYRVLVDHYLLDPNIIEVWDKEVAKIIREDKIKVNINESILEKIINSAKEILNWLKYNY